MANEQSTDNLSQESPDLSNDAVVNATMNVDTDSEVEFFSDLDKSVNSSFYQDAGVVEQTTSQEESPAEVPGSEEQQEQTHDWEKRYVDSSKEAKRLNTRVKELETYEPILDALKEDPNLVAHVKGYYTDGGDAPKSMKSKLGLDEDFVFDYDEALSDPKSDSAKVFGATVDGIVQQRLNEQKANEKNDAAIQSRESDFKTRNNLSDAQFADMMDWANKRVMTHDDILYLKNREGREDQVRKAAQDDILGQQKRMNERPSSLSTVGSIDKPQTSHEDDVFKAIKNVDTDIDNIFGV